MIRPRSAALAVALSLMLAGLMGPAHAAPARPGEGAPRLAEQCVEPAAGGTAAKGQPGDGRQPDHRTVTTAQKRAIAKRTDRELRGPGGRRALARRSDPSIRVFVHVMAAEDGTGDVTDAADRAADRRAQPGLRRRRGTRRGRGHRFSVRLARVDRYYNDKWHLDRQSKKYRRQTRQGAADDLNIWLVEFGYLGIATFPWDYAQDRRRRRDPGPLEQPARRHRDRTTTRATPRPTRPGHWLGLFHTFDGGCRKRGDEVDDTPGPVGGDQRLPRGPGLLPGRRPGLGPQLHGLQPTTAATTSSAPARRPA